MLNRLRWLASLMLVAGFSLPTTLAQGTLGVADVAVPTILDPITAPFNMASVRILTQVFDNLLFTTPDNQFEPWLVTSWEVVDDTTWIFQLRDDVTFHDGSPLTAEDVKFTLDRFLNPDEQAGAIAYLGGIGSVEVVDDYSFRVITKEPMPTLLFAMAFDTWVVPKAYFEAVGQEEFARHPIGSGPYQVADFTPGAEVRLIANPTYWAGAPTIAEVIWKSLPDASTRLAALKAGEIDIAINLPADIAVLLEDDDNAGAAEFFPLLTYSLAPDTIHGGPLADLRVRQALAYAIDGDSMLRDLFGGNGVRTSHPATSDTLGYNPDLEPWAFDPDRARELLAEAGYADGFSMTLFTRQGAERELTAGAVAAQWSEIGVETSVQVVESAVFIESRSADVSSEPRAYLDLWGTAGDSFFVTPWYTENSSWGVTYTNPESDAWIQEAANIVEVPRRVELYQQAWQRLHDDVAFIPLYNLPLFWGTSNVLEGLNLYGTQFLYLHRLSK